MRNDNKKNILASVIFVILILPFVYMIYLANVNYSHSKFRDISNPLGLSIEFLSISDKYITFVIKNPNNETYNIYFTNYRFRNSFGTSSIIINDPTIGVVYILEPNSTLTIKKEIYQSENDLKTVIFQWKKAGGTLTIVIDYSLADKPISGSIIYKISNSI